MRAIRWVSIAWEKVMGRLNGWPVFLGVALAIIAWSGSAAAADCFRYGQSVTLTGQYLVQVAPPDDGVVRDPRNDAARQATLLSLASPFCVDADAISVGVAAAVTVQLNCVAVHPANGSRLSVKGRLLGAHTGNGHPPVLLMCQ
jgi:hypothetical protein